MAIDFIKIDTSNPNTATQAALLKSYVQIQRSALETCARILAIMTHNNDGTTFTSIETLFGLPTGKGQTVFNFINGANGAMNGTFQVPDAKTLTEQLG